MVSSPVPSLSSLQLPKLLYSLVSPFVSIYTMSEREWASPLTGFGPNCTNLSGYLVLDWRMQFNNYVQRNGLVQFVAWPQPLQAGPQNAPTWTASVFSEST